MGVVVPYLMGGLGNWLFQVATALFLGKESAFISEHHCERSPHSKIDYFNTILKRVPRGIPPAQIVRVKENPFMEEINIPATLDMVKRVDMMIYGYFQHYTYIPDGFGELLDYKNPDLLQKYPTIGETCFLHVRGRDYVNHYLHDVGLSERYYPASIKFMKEKYGITQFVVFTNDKDYCTRRGYLKDINYEIIEENELDTLYLMTQCKAGITANSTFSWWGAYLNPKRPICLPSKWFNEPHMRISGYFFPGCYIQQV